jgi:tetratricopeptide (TPR) repeat protein
MGDRRDAFYVMKLLDGITLSDCIQQHHSSQANQGRQTRFQFGESLEPLLQRFVDVCNAVAYAHGRGVIHRDLKPSNVMTSDFGETIVLDWGLAHSQRPSAKADAGQRDESESVFQPTADTNSTTDACSIVEPDGTIVGTPAFMSPEQAAGQISAITEASDIYSLGVILYTIIAGRHPYRGQSVDDILSQVKNASYPRLRTIQPLTPSPLVSIVQRAMSADPSDRYGSAAQLASDVRRFIAGDSVSVHRESAVERGVRWCRHHQGIAASIVVSVSVLLIAAIGFSIVIKQSHRAERIARIEAQAAHREAVLSLTEARDATDAWLIDLSGSLQFFPGMETLRSELLDRAIDQYDRIAKQNLAASNAPSNDSKDGIADPSLTVSQHTERLALLERAKAFLRLGDLHRLAGNPQQSQQFYHQAKSILSAEGTTESVVPVTTVSLLPTGSLDQLFELERINALIGQLLSSKSETAETPSRESVELARRWLLQKTRSMEQRSQNPDSNPFDSFTCRVASAFVRMEMAFYFAASNRPDQYDQQEIESDYDEAIRIARLLVQRNDTVGHRRLSESIQSARCRSLTQSGQHPNAQRCWTILIDDLNRWLAVDPERIDYLQSLAHALLQRGNCLAELGDSDQATADYEASIRSMETAWRLTDADSFYRTNLATAENNLGQLLSHGSQRDPVMASQLLRQSLKTYEALLRENVTADRLRRYAQTHHALSLLSMAPADSDPVISSQHIVHAQKAIEAYEILGDYAALTDDDQQCWSKSKQLVAQQQPIEEESQRILATDLTDTIESTDVE